MAYTPVNWTNTPTTPLNAENLNHMEGGIIANESAIAESKNAFNAFAAFPNKTYNLIPNHVNFTTATGWNTVNSGTLTASGALLTAVSESNLRIYADLEKSVSLNANASVLIKIRARCTSGGTATLKPCWRTGSSGVVIDKSYIIAGNVKTADMTWSVGSTFADLWLIAKDGTAQATIDRVGVLISSGATVEVAHFECYYSQDEGLTSGELEDLQADVNQSRVDIGNLQTDVNGTKDNAGLKARMTTAEGNISALQATVNGSASTSGTIKNQIATAKTEVIEESVNPLAERVTAAESDITELENAGEAVRGQISELKSDIEKLDTIDIITGKFVDSNSGKYTNLETFSVYIYDVSIMVGHTLNISSYVMSRATYSIADKFGNILEIGDGSNGSVVTLKRWVVTIPKNGAYLRVSNLNSYTDFPCVRLVIEPSLKNLCSDSYRVLNEVGAINNGNNGKVIRISNGVNKYKDMNNIPLNSIATFVGLTNVVNSPVSSGSGTVICFNYCNQSTTNPYGGAVQLFFQLGVAKPKTYVRTAFSSPATWSDWGQLAYQSEIDSIKNSVLYTSLSSFLRIGVIGDSYASGWLNVSGKAKDWYNISWIQQLARMNGVTGINFSKGGLTTRTWLTDSNGLTKLNNTDACDLYYIVLGINDVNTLGINYLGSIDDCTDTPIENPDTFYGNMGRIINHVQTKAPNAKIILSTMANATGNFPTFNSAISEIAERFSLPCIVQLDDEFFTSSYYVNYKVGGHPTTQLYGGMARAIERLTDKCMKENPSYFNDIYPTSD